MGLGTYDFALAIGGEAGQGIATPGDILARIIVRRGLNLSTYNAYRSIVRGGHIFLTCASVMLRLRTMATNWTCSSALTKTLWTGTSVSWDRAAG